MMYMLRFEILVRCWYQLVDRWICIGKRAWTREKKWVVGEGVMHVILFQWVAIVTTKINNMPFGKVVIQPQCHVVGRQHYNFRTFTITLLLQYLIDKPCTFWCQFWTSTCCGEFDQCGDLDVVDLTSVARFSKSCHIWSWERSMISWGDLVLGKGFPYTRRIQHIWSPFGWFQFVGWKGQEEFKLLDLAHFVVGTLGGWWPWVND